MAFTLDRLIRDIRDRLILSEADAPVELVESWIDNAELKIWRLARARENRRYIQLELVGANPRSFELPVNSLAVVDVLAVPPGTNITRKSQSYIRSMIDSQPNSSNAFWAPIGPNVIFIGPAIPDTVYITDHYLRTGLTDIDGETMAAEIFPTFYNAYLFGALEDACDYYEYDDRQVKYAAKLQAEIREINESQSVLA